MEYPTKTPIEKRIKELDDYVVNAEASIKLYRQNITRAKREKIALAKLLNNKPKNKVVLKKEVKQDVK